MCAKFEAGAEFFFVLIIIAGAIISLLIPTKPLSYAIIILSGFAAGKIIYSRRNKSSHSKTSFTLFLVEEYQYLIIILAFVIGYILGAFNVSRAAIFFLFVGSLIVSYYFHYKKIFIYAK